MSQNNRVNRNNAKYGIFNINEKAAFFKELILWN